MDKWQIDEALAEEGPLWVYRAWRRQGMVQPDQSQELAAEKLQGLFHAVRHYQPQEGKPGGWKERFGLARRQRVQAPQGLYMYGGVGRGKSMLMDLFFDTVPIAAKRRVHFHAFMLEVHDRLHQWRAKTKGDQQDPLPELGGELASEAWLVCFDEFHVVNIADAMILSRLFEAMFEQGAVVVATSNWPPDELYKGGLQRDRFLPFVDLLKQRLDVLALEGDTDYRLRSLEDMGVYHCPLNEAAGQAVDAAFNRLTEGSQARSEVITVKGRSLTVSATARGVARFTFAELCEAALGPADYLEIAQRYHTIVLSGIPSLGPENRNEARRFMTLVDALYEHRVNLVASAAAAPDQLYPEGHGAFEFERTASRLIEMRSSAYMAEKHLVEAADQEASG